MENFLPSVAYLIPRGLELTAPDVTEAEAFAAGMHPAGASHAWMNALSPPARRTPGPRHPGDQLRGLGTAVRATLTPVTGTMPLHTGRCRL